MTRKLCTLCECLYVLCSFLCQEKKILLVHSTQPADEINQPSVCAIKVGQFYFLWKLSRNRSIVAHVHTPLPAVAIRNYLPALCNNPLAIAPSYKATAAKTLQSAEHLHSSEYFTR